METKKRYKESLDYLFSRLPMFSRTGAPAYKPGLETSLELSHFFDNPHKKFKSIHVGGTNGKGSTSHMLASVLQAEGYKVGLYTSPHLVDFRERMRINGEMIPEEKVISFVDSWKKSGYKGHPSFFELTMVMAFEWFAEENVDYAVIEVGMGGRLDSTNIITPELSVITNISHDHNQFLGESLTQIASEKAGIIKSGKPVVIGEKHPETENVFIKKAEEEGSKITFAEEDKDITVIKDIPEGWYGQYGDIDLILPLKGDYQAKNLRTVLSVIGRLRDTGIKIKDSSVKEGIEHVCENTGLLGRWTLISGNPLTIADTGHNLAGISYNFTQLSRIIKNHQGSVLRVVIGFVADKAIEKILSLLPEEAVYYITNANIPRAMPGERLKEKFIAAGLDGRVYPNVEEAYLAAKREASEEDIIFIGGSTFIVADFLHYFYAGHDF